MPKITNWSRREDLENKDHPKVWQNDNTDTLVQVIAPKKPDGDYLIEIDGRRQKPRTPFTKQEAIKFLREWMKDHPYEDVELEGDELHSKLLEVGREVEPDSQGVANDLEDDEIETIVSTVAFFDNKGLATKQTQSDLTPPTSYRVFDWLGMMIDTDLDNERLEWMFEELARIYIQEKDVDGFVHQLRMQDLQVQMPSELRRR